MEHFLIVSLGTDKEVDDSQEVIQVFITMLIFLST